MDLFFLHTVAVEPCTAPRFPVADLLIKKSEWNIADDDMRTYKGQLVIDHGRKVIAEATATDECGYLNFHFYDIDPAHNKGMPYFRADLLTNDPVDVWLLVQDPESQEWQVVPRPVHPDTHEPLTKLYANQAAFPFTIHEYDQAQTDTRQIVFFESWHGIPAYLNMQDGKCQLALPEPTFPHLEEPQVIMTNPGDFVTVCVPTEIVREYVKHVRVEEHGIGQLCSYDPSVALISFPNKEHVYEANLCATRLFYMAWKHGHCDWDKVTVVYITLGSYFPMVNVYNFKHVPAS